MKNNVNKFQLHIHSSCSIDTPMSKRNLGKEIVNKGRKKGLNVIITDHDNIDFYNRNLQGKGVDGLVSAEMTIIPRKARKLSYFPNVMFHYLVYDIKNFDDLIEVAKKGDLDEFYQLLKDDKDLRHALAHPITRIPGDAAAIDHRVEVAKHYADVLELNCSSTRLENILTMKIADEHDKGLIIGGDDHVGNPFYGIMYSTKNDFHEFFDSVKDISVYQNKVSIGGFDYKIPSMKPLRQQDITLRYIRELMKSNKDDLKRKGFNPLFGSQFFDDFVMKVLYGNYGAVKGIFLYSTMWAASLFGKRYFKHLIINPRNKDVKNYLRGIYADS